MGATVFTAGMSIEVWGSVSIQQGPYLLRLGGEDDDGLNRCIVETREHFVDRKREEAKELADMGAVVVFNFYDNDDGFGCTMVVGNCVS